MESDVRAGDGRRARPAVGLEHVAVDRDVASPPSPPRSTTARSERPISRWISCVRPRSAASALASVAPVAGRGQHRVLGGDPALPGTAPPATARRPRRSPRTRPSCRRVRSGTTAVRELEVAAGEAHAAGARRRRVRTIVPSMVPFSVVAAGRGPAQRHALACQTGSTTSPDSARRMSPSQTARASARSSSRSAVGHRCVSTSVWAPASRASAAGLRRRQVRRAARVRAGQRGLGEQDGRRPRAIAAAARAGRRVATCTRAPPPPPRRRDAQSDRAAHVIRRQRRRRASDPTGRSSPAASGVNASARQARAAPCADRMHCIRSQQARRAVHAAAAACGPPARSVTRRLERAQVREVVHVLVGDDDRVDAQRVDEPAERAESAVPQVEHEVGRRRPARGGRPWRLPRPRSWPPRRSPSVAWSPLVARAASAAAARHGRTGAPHRSSSAIETCVADGMGDRSTRDAELRRTPRRRPWSRTVRGAARRVGLAQRALARRASRPPRGRSPRRLEMSRTLGPMAWPIAAESSGKCVQPSTSVSTPTRFSGSR